MDELPQVKKPDQEADDKAILAQYEAKYNKTLKPVKRRSIESDIQPEVECPQCGCFAATINMAYRKFKEQFV